MNKKIILLSVLVVLGVVALGQVAYAATSTVSVLPATANKNVGTTFNATVNLVPQGNKVCVVKGTLSFVNLTCRSISVDPVFEYAIKTPTCASPSFTLGIPGCTTTTQNVLTVSVKGNNIGQAILPFTGIKLIGGPDGGTDVTFLANGGLYNITAVPKPTPTLTSDLTAYNAALSAVTESDYTVESWATYQTVVIANPATTEDTQADVDTATANITAAQSALVLKADLTPNPEDNIPADVGAAGLLSVASEYFWPILIVLIILCAGYGIYYLVKRKKK